jgi:hypothetical protein
MKTPRPLPSPAAGGAVKPRRSLDLTWGRVVFLPPGLLNPRIIFDPPPMRTRSPCAPLARAAAR